MDIDDQEIENAMYSGWFHSHFFSSVIAFSADDSIIQCHINAPGSWHDSCMAQPIYDTLCTNTPDRYYLIAGRIKAPIKSGQCLPSDPAERQKLLLFNWQLLSFCQMAEWGMHALQGSFGQDEQDRMVWAQF
ncbi:hypothetical protein BDR04DRAFT_1128693 [Suillus decipiens]|nr:hypothetical protein BDR04DRAFT_1128693 [Suillus decipiens]